MLAAVAEHVHGDHAGMPIPIQLHRSKGALLMVRGACPALGQSAGAAAIPLADAVVYVLSTLLAFGILDFK